MIEYLSGKVAELTPTTAVVDVNGVGYELNITLTTFSSLEQAVGGQLGERQAAGQAKLYVHEVIREDAWTLYGFASKRERELFRELIGVSGVGSASARMILSSISPAELEQVITSGDERRLKAVKGIGGKTAQRIIVDLRDKIKPSGDSLLIQPGTPQSDVYDEALAALVMLGFAKPASQKVLSKLFSQEPTLKVEQAIKKALTML
ncbi:MAG: Holliday junction branch migration protein RuvA [Muribaculaceae bacterium]|jgi:Holliday junction DNA helicase RuvA|nr:Holliday junction branch migration protein RuvA [Muribaculaceae bacterium]